MTGSEVVTTLSSSAATAADVGEGAADELKGPEVEDGKAVAEVAMTLASSAATAADVGEGEADELKGPEVEDGKAVAAIAMTFSSSAATAAGARGGEADELEGAGVEDGKAVGWKRKSKSRVSLLLLMVNGEQALSLKPRASDTELVTHVCCSGLPCAFKVRTKE